MSVAISGANLPHSAPACRYAHAGYTRLSKRSPDERSDIRGQSDAWLDCGHQSDKPCRHHGALPIRALGRNRGAGPDEDILPPHFASATPAILSKMVRNAGCRVVGKTFISGANQNFEIGIDRRAE